MSEQWRVNEFCMGVGIDALTNSAFVAVRTRPTDEGWTAEILQIDHAGKKIGSTIVGGARNGTPHMLQVARSPSTLSPVIITGGFWEDGLNAFDFATGQHLWEYTTPDGLNCLLCADVDQNGEDEILIGCNARGGVEVLDLSGRLRWRSGRTGGVRSIAVAANRADGARTIITNGLDNRLHIFAPDGTWIRDLRLSIDPLKISMASRTAGGEQFIVAAEHDQVKVAAFEMDGAPLWQLRDTEPARRGFVDIAAAADRPWVAITTRDGRLLVYDVVGGKRIAWASTQSARRIGWLRGTAEHEPLLIVASPRSLFAYSIAETPSGTSKP